MPRSGLRERCPANACQSRSTKRCGRCCRLNKTSRWWDDEKERSEERQVGERLGRHAIRSRLSAFDVSMIRTRLGTRLGLFGPTRSLAAVSGVARVRGCLLLVGAASEPLTGYLRSSFERVRACALAAPSDCTSRRPAVRASLLAPPSSSTATPAPGQCRWTSTPRSRLFPLVVLQWEWKSQARTRQLSFSR